MPPRERQHEGLGGDWGILLRLDWEPLQGAWVDHRSGQTRMPPQERRHEEVFGLGDSFTRSGVDGTPPCGGAGEGGWGLFFVLGDSFTL